MSAILDEPSLKPRKFLVDVEETMRLVLEQEDTDNKAQIHITDSGPKVFALGTVGSNGYRTVDVSWASSGSHTGPISALYDKRGIYRSCDSCILSVFLTFLPLRPRFS